MRRENDIPEFMENVLILQGGGSLGAFGCGVFKALVKARDYKIDIAAGTSIGGVNASIIAGSKDDHPENALEQLWIELAENNSKSDQSAKSLEKFWRTAASFYLPYDQQTIARNHFQARAFSSFYNAALYGNERMFLPRWRPEYASTDPQYLTPKKWTYLYDHSPLEKTLDKYIDYNKLRPEGRPNARLIMTAVDVLTAEPITFDSSRQQITSKHVLATSAYPIYYFPWVEVEKGRYCWDGSLLSNTPLREVIDASPVIDKKIFIVENYPKNIDSLPQNIPEVMHRVRDIIFSDKTLHNVKLSKVITRYLRFIEQLYQMLETHADMSKLDKDTVDEIRRKYRKFKREHGAEIKSICYITREEEHPHIYENADFSVEAIKASIKEGESRTQAALEKMEKCS